jgi:hypothetical protein
MIKHKMTNIRTNLAIYIQKYLQIKITKYIIDDICINIENPNGMQAFTKYIIYSEIQRNNNV